MTMKTTKTPWDGMLIKVANPGPKIFGDLSSRSFNGYPAKVGTVYYVKSQGRTQMACSR